MDDQYTILSTKNTKTIGQKAEDYACHYLQRQGLRLITRNYRCKLGEIDIIMQDKKQLVFVEVRFRRHAHYGGALYSIDQRKQQKIIACAQHYLVCHGKYAKIAARFDVILLTQHHPYPIQTTWIPNAFDNTTTTD